MLKNRITRLKVSDKAKEIRDSPFKKFMTTDGRRLFVTEIPIDYPQSQVLIEKAEKLLEKWQQEKILIYHMN